MDVNTNEKHSPERCERKEVVIIGNGPSAIVLSYLLSGHIPYWNGCPVSNEYLNMKLEQYVKDSSLLEQDFEFLSDGLEGRSKNSVSLLIDHLTHPNADLGAHLQSKLKWRHDPSRTIDHVCLGRGGLGGVWNRLTSKQFQTVSMAHWMELPNYPMNTFRQQRRVSGSRLSVDENTSVRATYEEVRSYYINYVKRNRLTKSFRNHCEVLSLERITIDTPFDDSEKTELCPAELLWKISGYDESNQRPFVIHAKYVVLATGYSHEITRPLGIIGEQSSQSFTYTNLYDIEQLIHNTKQLRTTSKPLLLVGCGLSAIDVLLLCQQHCIPVLHVFRRAVDDHEVVFNQLSATLYPEYDRIKELMKQSATKTTFSTSDWSYQSCSQSEIVSISEVGTVHIRNLRTQIIREFDISFVARLTGMEVDVPFIRSVTTEKHTSLHINPYTYECMDFDCMYALGVLAGDKLVRFLQGGAFACAASLFKKHRHASLSSACRSRMSV